MKLHVGCGENVRPGYEGIDRLFGKEAYPLEYADNSASEVYASHILEHFSHRITVDVLTDWTRVLRPGGQLYISVPDLNRIDPLRQPLWRWYIMGGQIDANDIHYAVFTERSLAEAMDEAGLVDIRRWESRQEDCSRFPISANLVGTKPKFWSMPT